MAILYDQTRNLTHGKLTILDGSVSPKSLVVPIDEGNLRFTVNDAAAVVMNRATPSHFTPLPKVPCAIQFTIKFSEWLGKNGAGFASAAPSVPDALRGKGNAIALSWVSSTACGPWTTDLQFDIANVCAGAAAGTDQAEKLVFADFHADTFEFNEGTEYDTLVISGRALVSEPAPTRTGA